MQVSPVKSNRFISPKVTGYAATGCLVASVYSGISKNKTIRKTHKPFAYLAAALTLMHIIQIEHHHIHRAKKIGS